MSIASRRYPLGLSTASFSRQLEAKRVFLHVETAIGTQQFSSSSVAILARMGI
ncbi:MAG: hypothetical protein P8Y67_13355 [Alphaproteobacteria bacterium]